MCRPLCRHTCLRLADRCLCLPNQVSGGPRGALRFEYEDLDLEDLRLELHKVVILLRNLEDSREKPPPAIDGDAAADGGGGAGADAGAGSAGGGTPPQALITGGAMGRAGSTGPAGKMVAAGAGSRDSRAGARARARARGETLPKAGQGGGNSGEKEAVAAVATTAAGATGNDVTRTEDAAHPRNSAGQAATKGGDGGGGGAGGGSVLSETDRVAAFWAALAAATPTTPPRIEGEEEEEEEEEEEDGVWGGTGDSPLANGTTYDSLSVPLRVAILGLLCEEYMDFEHFRLRVIVSRPCGPGLGPPDVIVPPPIPSALLVRFGWFGLGWITLIRLDSV